MDGYEDFRALKRVLAENVNRLMTHHWGAVNKSRLARDAAERDPVTGQVLAKAGQGTHDRLLDESKDVGIAVVRRIARAFHLQAWQLLVPNLDPEHPPTCRALSPLAADLAASFDRIEDEAIRRSLHATIDQLARKNPAASQAAPSPEPTPSRHRTT